MKIEIENLKAQMTGRNLNIHQKADALIEFNKLLDYVEELEQLSTPRVSNSKNVEREKAYQWVFNKMEEYQNRYIKAEKLLIKIMWMPWWKKLTCSKSILEYLKINNKQFLLLLTIILTILVISASQILNYTKLDKKLHLNRYLLLFIAFKKTFTIIIWQ